MKRFMQAKLKVIKIEQKAIVIPLTGIESADVFRFDAEQFALFNQDLVNHDDRFMVSLEPKENGEFELDVVAVEMPVYDFINGEYDIVELLINQDFKTPQVITFR